VDLTELSLDRSKR